MNISPFLSFIMFAGSDGKALTALFDILKAFAILFSIGLIAAGIVLLYYGAEFLLSGGVSLARRAGMSQLVVGVTLAAFATSSPEFVVSVSSALNGAADVSIGNVVGSNICNIALILGLCAMIRPLPVNPALKRFDMPVMVAASVILVQLYGLSGGINRIWGAVLTLGIIVYTTMSVIFARREGAKRTEESAKTEDEKPEKLHSTAISLLLVAVGLTSLIVGTKVFLKGALLIADACYISEAVTGLTIVAVGTSLPELATSVVAAIRKQNDIAIGNIIGSCIFNILAIPGVVSMISPLYGKNIRIADFIVMGGVTILLSVMMLTGKKLSRIEGAILFATYCGYTAWLIAAHQ